MSYQLGIDLGTTYTAAAVYRPAGGEVVTLGTNSAAVASVVYLGPDGTVLFGEAAERRAVTDPGRVIREFKRRIGDDTPLVIDGAAHPVPEIAAQMIQWVIERVTEQEGGPPQRIAVTHPASWGGHKRQLLTDALGTAGLRVRLLAEPQAAAVSYATTERVEPGSTIAVYDLGGGTFDAAVVRKTGNGTFELLGRPEGIDRLGGVDFDEAVFGHVTAGLGDTLGDLDPGDPDVLTAVAQLRRECVQAKEALSADTEVTIPVFLPGHQTQARLTRAEFEGMIRPALEHTVEVLGRAIASAGIARERLDAVLLVGGSSRIPLVSRLLSAELERPIAVDADPRTAIALGAAISISDRPDQARTMSSGKVPPQPGHRPSRATMPPVTGQHPAPGHRPSRPPGTGQHPAPGRRPSSPSIPPVTGQHAGAPAPGHRRPSSSSPSMGCRAYL